MTKVSVLFSASAQNERDKIMGNHTSKKDVSKKEKRKRDFPQKLQKWSTGWAFTDKHRKAIEEGLSRHKLQDIVGIFLSILGEDDTFRTYYRLTCPKLCDTNNDNTISTDYYIPPDWIKLLHCLIKHIKQTRTSLQYIYIYTYTDKEKKGIKIVITGNGGFGKTSLLHRLVLDRFVEQYDPTIEDDFRKEIQLNNESSCLVQCTDTSGQEEYLPLTSQWPRPADCIIIVYDVCELSTPTETVTTYLRRLQFEKSVIIVAGTKADLRGSLSKYQNNYKSIVEFCKLNNLPYIETSAKDNVNVDFLFQYVIYHAWFNTLND
ncbi:hypothetical protein RFI_16232 [Reticulomyxa filosa]|uniref:Ras family small GTPase n=1 Tax=Reticulomyxa filosa TaxID=46433 RepID=X6N3X4_RETFI|nr:hypothetical protein RFI_16232 [Reticulomyxa filosa]|eukprot:ETO20975.1 hypothetical protein RFI_16232 [Reticulomyxa filosa]